MKTIKFLLILLLLNPFFCMAQSGSKTTQTVSNDKIEVYYFHFSARCVTCKTVEAETKKDLETLYPEKVKSGAISFRAVNLEDASGKEIAERLKISGQNLLLVKGSQKINITNEGFLYAVSNPEKFKSIIRTKVDGLLK